MDSKIKELKKENWPPLLFEIPNKPKKIYFKGEIPNWERKLLCIVGSRKYTNYGKEVTEMLIAGLSGYPVTIVSGLALGIDSIAHVNALKNKLPTIAIPGSGLSSNVLHPQSNKILANKIIENGGTLLSEYEEDFKATYWSFPQRNRIMAGMCHATLVIEAEKKSGTLITSRLATEYNRDVLTVPGSLWSSTSEGPLMLLRLGATPIRNSDDILDTLNIKKVNNEEDDENKYFDCSEKEMLIIRILKEPQTRDLIIRTLKENNINVGESQTLLSLLELKGLIKETLGEIRKV